jgi:hypothetical protein
MIAPIPSSDLEAGVRVESDGAVLLTEPTPISPDYSQTP